MPNASYPFFIASEPFTTFNEIDRITCANSRSLFETWITYKKEQHKFRFKPTGLRAAVTRFLTFIEINGFERVASEIESAMASGWRGYHFNLRSEPHSSDEALKMEIFG